jgi:transglutaminase-like putative cysteine protease
MGITRSPPSGGGRRVQPVEWEAGDPAEYLGADGIIDGKHPAVAALAGDLRARYSDDHDFARAAYEWVRDEVAHAYDAQDPRVTFSASEVLEQGVGLCYAKSNLLAAILRSGGVPTALCYQRLGDPDEGYFVHGLVAVHLAGGWHRQDPRGNKPGLDAQFSISDERLAWRADTSRGECDYSRFYVTPAPEVVSALRAADNILTCSLPATLE